MINKQHEKLFGIKPVDITGKTDYDFFPREMSDKYSAVDNLVLETGQTIQIEEEGLHKDGTVHTYISSKFPLYDSEGEIYAVCGVSTDITESKKAIAQKESMAMKGVLQRSEAKYAELTENMPNLFFALDANMHVIYWNKTCEVFTGEKATAVMGKGIKEVFPNLISDIPDRCMQVLKTEEAYNSVIQFDYLDRAYSFLINIYPTEQGISVLMTNISDQKRAERETLDLVDSLQRKNKDLRQFAYIVSHNLRAPIAKIQGLSSLIGVSGMPGGPDESEILHHITEEAVHLDNVVKDLNMIITARDSGGEIKEYISFEDQFNLIKQVLENEISDSRANITTDFTSLKGVMSVKGYIYSIMYNLISNAVKYRSPQRSLRIHLRTFKDEKYSWLIIQDNGLGIDMKRNADKIFGLYKRFHDHVDGKGIGLHLVKTQAEALGGGAEVESQLNEGTTFKIFFK
jgi:PAS domain S-box-containing protein